MKFEQIASEGGLLPMPIVRNTFELWPAKRREFIVDFTKYKDGTPTREGRRDLPGQHEKMSTAARGQQRPAIPGPDAEDRHRRRRPRQQHHSDGAAPRCRTSCPARGARPRTEHRTFELQRGSSGGDPETEWLINGPPFKLCVPHVLGQAGLGRRLADPERRRRLGAPDALPPGGAPHRRAQRQARAGRPAARRFSKEDVIALDPGDEVVISRRFRTFVGPYVAHCHNLAHEDHNMMFGWQILP